MVDRLLCRTVLIHPMCEPFFVHPASFYFVTHCMKMDQTDQLLEPSLLEKHGSL